MSDLAKIDDTPRSALAIGAHPDDIELYAGGTLARWREAGCDTAIVVCTDGGAGSRNRDAGSGQLTAIRSKEQHAAARILGVTNVEMLDWPDGSLEDTHVLRAELVRLIRLFRPEAVLTHDPHAIRHFLHRDHRITGQVVLDAVYPFARDHLHFPEHLDSGLKPHRVNYCLLWQSDYADSVVDISTTLSIKADAIGAHASQLEGILQGCSLQDWVQNSAEVPDCGSGSIRGEIFRLLRAPP